MRYPKFVDKVIKAYRAIGYRPEPFVWIDKNRGICNPLVVLLLHECGHGRFFCSASGFYSIALIRHELYNMFGGNWQWVTGVIDGHDKIQYRTFAYSKSYRAGYKVGRELRRRLKIEFWLPF